MNDRMQILEDLDVLVRMCRSKNDGASLVIEEEEIKQKISELELEIEELKTSADEENYDTAAEMADRNIEIITKKVINTIKIELKNKNNELLKLKEKEKEASDNLNSIKSNKKSHGTYISSMQERIASTTDEEIIDRYNSLISESETKVVELEEELKTITETYTELQTKIEQLAKEIEELNNRLASKQEQLLETQHNLESKETYIDQSKLERNNKKIEDINLRKEKLESRLIEISNDPKYLEVKIKKIINENGDMEQAKGYLKSLISNAIEQPYMNVDADNALEEELLRATQARDTFANEIDQKNYNVMESESPEQIRIEYLNERINYWNNDLQVYENKIALVDKDEQFNYQQKDERIANLIASLKEDYEGYKKAYEEEPDTNLSTKASLKVSYEEKKEDLANAERIAAQFKYDEAEDIKIASNLVKNECEKIKNNINSAKEEIDNIKNRLMTKKSGMIDINAQNRDKEKLKKLADTVMDIKHRRQFAEKPEVIARRLETSLSMELLTEEMLKKVYETDNKVDETVVEQPTLDQQPTQDIPQEFSLESEMQYPGPTVDMTQTSDIPTVSDITSNPEFAMPNEPVAQPYINEINPISGVTPEEPMVNQTQLNPESVNVQPIAMDIQSTPVVEPVAVETSPITPIEPVGTIAQFDGIQEVDTPVVETNTVDLTPNNDNIVSSNIADELDQYINSLSSTQV
ncbi:MAG: hypothetical protein ACI4WW_08875 [Candidatus Coprovivens sp.]